MTRARGFTLIELVIAVAIVALLSAIAVRSYLKNTLKTNRANGTECLVETQKRIEDYYSRNNTDIAGDLRKVGFPAATGGACPATNGTAAQYTLSITQTSGSPDYTLTATGIGSQAKDGTLVLAYTPNTGELVKTHITPHGATETGWIFNSGQ